MEKQKLYAQHEEHVKWMNDLKFYQDEMKVSRNRLAEIAAKNNSKEILAQIEHFQNQMIVQQNNIDTLKHTINIGNDDINAEIRKNGTAVDHRTLADQAPLRDEMESFIKVYNDNKNELNRFLSEWM